MLGESFNSKSSGQNSYALQDVYANLVSLQPEQMGTSFGLQGNSFGQKLNYIESKPQTGYVVTPEMWKSSFGQEQDYHEQQYLIEGYDEMVASSQCQQPPRDQFELKFEDMRLEDPAQQQYQRAQKSKSMIEVESNPNKKSRKSQPKNEYSIANAEQISMKFKPEIAAHPNILNDNSDLFNINQAKSIYINKISQLVDRPQSPNTSVSPRSSKSQQKYQRKVSVKIEKGETDYYSSQEQYEQSKLSSDPLQQKLAKNRESARNSRKRKKIYVELLESKVTELTQECDRLRELCKNQNNQAQKQGQDIQQIKDFFDQQQELFNKLERVLNDGKLPEQQQGEINLILDALRFRTSSNTNERLVGGRHFVDDMVKISLPVQSRYIMKSAETGKDLFSNIPPSYFDWSADLFSNLRLSAQQQQQLLKMKGKVRLCRSSMEKNIEQIQTNLMKINQEAAKVDQIMDNIRLILAPRQYAQLLQCINQNSFRPELGTSQIFENLVSSLASNEDDQPFQFAIDEQELPQCVDRLESGRKQLKTRLD